MQMNHAYAQAAAVVSESQISEDEYSQHRNVVESDLLWDKENKTLSPWTGASPLFEEAHTVHVSWTQELCVEV